MRIAQEEIFGPTTALIPVDSFEEAIRVANGVKYGLSSSIFTGDVNRAFRAIRDLDTGITYVNAGTIGAEVHLPFGGTKDTGNGHREAGQAALDVFTEWKSVYVDYSGKLQTRPDRRHRVACCASTASRSRRTSSGSRSPPRTRGSRSSGSTSTRRIARRSSRRADRSSSPCSTTTAGSCSTRPRSSTTWTSCSPSRGSSDVRGGGDLRRLVQPRLEGSAERDRGRACGRTCRTRTASPSSVPRRRPRSTSSSGCSTAASGSSAASRPPTAPRSPSSSTRSTGTRTTTSPSTRSCASSSCRTGTCAGRGLDPPRGRYVPRSMKRAIDASRISAPKPRSP